MKIVFLVRKNRFKNHSTRVDRPGVEGRFENCAILPRQSYSRQI